MDFKAGDKVELKSGGPTMTVASVQNDGTLWCVWFNQTGGVFEHKGLSFKRETLKIA